MMIASDDGPAMSGMAIGTIKGSICSPLFSAGVIMFFVGKTIPRATKKSNIPPDMFRVAGSSPSISSTKFPAKKKKSNIASAQSSSRRNIRLCRFRAYPFIIPCMVGANPTGSITMTNKMMSEKNSCIFLVLDFFSSISFLRSRQSFDCYIFVFTP